ncbi:MULTISPECIES: acyl-CoA thioesterase II [unclassified Pseudofrankia]|uniref:acyl-CoA thioesterase n=1 Tax=unclassified Pseudofrankia TaxID=2994372 RepID=UPI0008D9CA37|nr:MULTISPECIES: acyl-CoA thioesterase domain-containing protein [unclassified Pseudofrankia]MDT3439253.1 thioesterase family protein [Pseudofrankia sp. BMG5.37]OHV43795.1 acyl-CoA thioesterase II [Pseudofrankia sp. BMG5.36]
MDSPAHPRLDTALLDALDALLGALEPQRLTEDRFRVPPDAVRAPGRVYGGQLLAQALVAAGSSVSGKAPHSLHAAFVRAGTPGRPLDLTVDRVRDGRSMSTRQVTVLEDDKPLLVAIVSFHDGGAESSATAPAPPAPPPDDVPLLQQWARQLPADMRQHGRHWIEQPPPVEMRISEAPSFLGGPRAPTTASATRSHWMRLPRAVGDDPLLHTALLAYASDFLLMDMVFRAHPGAAGPGRSNGLSLDHAIWFHRPARFDRWHLHTQETLAIAGNRGLTHGAIHDADGHLVATVMQEVLVLPVTAP